MFRIGSITKTFTAVMVMQLIEEGQLTLDTEVTDVLPGLAVAEAVTVRQLLDHSSGLAEFNDPGFDRMLRADWDRTWTSDQVLERVADLVPQVAVPGTLHNYSNTNYVVAGMMVEEITGQSLAENLRTRITGPLSLTDTAYGPDGPDPVTGFAVLLPDGNTEGVSYQSVQSAAGAAGAMVSTAPDLVTFFAALDDGVVLSSQTWDQMPTSRTLRKDPYLGWAWWRSPSPDEQASVISGTPTVMDPWPSSCWSPTRCSWC